MNPIQQQPDSGGNKASDELQIRIAVCGFFAVMMSIISIFPVGADIAPVLGVAEPLVTGSIWAVTIGFYITTGILARYYDKHYRTEPAKFQMTLLQRARRTKPMDKFGATGQG